jgi:hypothetical protein
VRDGELRNGDVTGLRVNDGYRARRATNRLANNVAPLHRRAGRGVARTATTGQRARGVNNGLNRGGSHLANNTRGLATNNIGNTTAYRNPDNFQNTVYYEPNNMLNGGVMNTADGVVDNFGGMNGMGFRDNGMAYGRNDVILQDGFGNNEQTTPRRNNGNPTTGRTMVQGRDGNRNSALTNRTINRTRPRNATNAANSVNNTTIRRNAATQNTNTRNTIDTTNDMLNTR